MNIVSDRQMQRLNQIKNAMDSIDSLTNLNGERIGELQRQPYGRNLWAVYIRDIRRVFINYDCFSFVNAKRVAKHFITGENITLKY